MRPFLLTFCFLLASSRLCGGSPEQWFDAPKSRRATHYEIKGALDWPSKKFEGRMKLTWQNTGTVPTQELPFCLYLNSAAHSKGGIGGKAKPGACKIIAANCNGAALDGRLAEGDTIYWVKLPAPIAPNESVQVIMSWVAQFPMIKAGSGWAGHYLVASLWYPKLGTYKGDRWLSAPLPENAAFSGDHAVFDVELSLPNLLQLANTGTVLLPMDDAGNYLTDSLGRIVEATHDPDRRLYFIYKIHAEDVKDFSWAAAPSGSWGLSRMSYGDVQVYFYCIPKNGDQLPRLKEATWNALRRLEQQFGPYPYPILSIVDLPKNASSALASPTLAYISNISFDPLQQRIVPELAALNQVGDQFFGGAAGLDLPNEYPLYQPLSSWFASKTLKEEYTAAFTSKRFFMETFFPEWYARHPIPSGVLDGLHSFLSRGLPGGRGKAGTWYIDHIEGWHGGWTESEIRLRIADNYFNPNAKWDATSVRPDKLAWRIASVNRTPQGSGEITIELAGATGDGASIVQPITLRVRLENGEELSRVWNGHDLRATFTFSAPIATAEIWQGEHILGQGNRLRSTYTAKPLKRGVAYWAHLVIGAVGGMLQGIGIG
ncbi:MAG: hypothetical protein LBC63_07250 [Holophagales bacterium]|jgi:hypothetical protein|nr:hypothetical protein [Holophagales bacterium]